MLKFKGLKGDLTDVGACDIRHDKKQLRGSVSVSGAAIIMMGGGSDEVRW